MAQWSEHSPSTIVAWVRRIPGPGVICGLSLLLVLVRFFSFFRLMKDLTKECFIFGFN